ncbi:hypothetical protein PVK06_007372 [Gossypium arboreum]|uniref:Uncharacterized protein n=1 Tax=Gossypium arboreum TaxID=29729 RepID=A0ABR0QI53_GOSAR|nr:hypothetical protein PVK06_007372 [Gossypium arboreum]
MQLELFVEGDTVTDSSGITNHAALCYDLLGHSPSDGTNKFIGLKFSWLKENFETLLDYTIEIEKIQVARAYILQLIRGYLCQIPIIIEST